MNPGLLEVLQARFSIDSIYFLATNCPFAFGCILVEPGFLSGAMFKLYVLSKTELTNLLPEVVIPSVFCKSLYVKYGVSFVNTLQYSIPASPPVVLSFYDKTLEPLVSSLYPSLKTLLTWLIALPTCFNFVIPCTLSAALTNLCVESKIDDGLNVIFVDSLLVYCELIWLNSLSNEPTPPPGVAL